MNATCPGVTYDQGSRQVTLRLGGQEFKSKSLPSAHGPSELVFLSGKVLCCFPRSRPHTLSSLYSAEKSCH